MGEKPEKPKPIRDGLRGSKITDEGKQPTMTSSAVAFPTDLFKSLELKIDGMRTSMEAHVSGQINSLRDLLTNVANVNKNELKQEIEKAKKAVMESMDLEIAQVVARIERVEKSLGETTEKLTPRFDPNVSITIAGLPFQGGKNVYF